LTLRRRLPQTLAALEDGDLSRAAAEMIADEAENLDIANCSRLEDSVLPEAGSRSYRSLRNKVRRAVAKLDADAVRKRKERAKDERCVYLTDEADGMAALHLHGPAELVQAIYAALNEKVLAAQLGVKAAHGDAPLVLPTRDDRRLGAQRHDMIVEILGTGLGIDPWAPPVPTSSFLTEAQIAGLDRHAGTYRPTEAMKAAVRNRDATLPRSRIA
jgi:hypothetical protein